MKADKIIKWHETKSISIANEICGELYDTIIDFCNEKESDISMIEEIHLLLINKI